MNIPAFIPVINNDFKLPQLSTDKLCDAILDKGQATAIGVQSSITGYRTPLILQIAARVGQSIIILPSNAEMETVESTLIDAITNGHWLVIDEIKIQTPILNNLSQLVTIKKAAVTVHKHYRLFLTGDLLPRWVDPVIEIKADIPEVLNLVNKFQAARLGDTAEAFVDAANDLRSAHDQGLLSIRMTESDLENWVGLVVIARFDAYKANPDEIKAEKILLEPLNTAFVNKLPINERETAIKIVSNKFIP